ncbi:hypothetical protein N836_34610 [Leptolyngbya sp. Heron Island J]|uniref:hypothetical protein n=1 Tax=Leptolyngbya sp. Heron Island J TaxID=1385935 RepID=UPI0003B9E562|nr:hypothetical protein [Leptolyngbya sp. Heron Island J]ESA37927.1 hypothetical protein N836_34610 [Leptolyngbya sp. Heron Island J]
MGASYIEWILASCELAGQYWRVGEATPEEYRNRLTFLVTSITTFPQPISETP